MKTIEERIEEAFARYGIKLSHFVIRSHIERGKKSIGLEHTRKEFINEVCNRFCYGRERIRIANFPKFFEKVKVGEEWRNMPAYFSEEITIYHFRDVGKFGIDEKNKYIPEQWTEEMPNEDYQFFEMMLKDKEREEFFLKKAFVPDSLELLGIRQTLIGRAYKEFGKAMRDNLYLDELSEEIKDILKIEYDVYVR